MRKQLLILISFIGLAFCQQISLTQNAHLYGGAEYYINENSGSGIKFHAITVGQNIVGSASSANYNMDFGIWAFYLNQPDAPTVNASDGDPTHDFIRITYSMDPLSPPAYLTEIPENIGAYPEELGGYATTASVQENIVALTKSQDGNISSTTNDITGAGGFGNSMTPNDPYTWSNDIRPGIMYSFGVTTFNSYGISPEGTDIGFTIPNGRVEGMVNVPGSLPGTTGNGVKDVEIKIQRSDGQTMGHSLILDGEDDYLYADNIYDELLIDTLQTNDMSIEFWFKNPENSDREYILDMDEMLFIYQENSNIHATFGNDEIASNNTDLDSYKNEWHHIAITKGNRGACLRDNEIYDDANSNGQWDGGEGYIDDNQNSFYDAAGVVDGIETLEDCFSDYTIVDSTGSEAGEVFNWDPAYYASGIRMYIDGELDTSKALSNDAIISSNIFNIGRSKDGVHFYSGSIDDLRIWGHARTGDEISKNKNRFLSGKEEGLLGYWKMDAGMLDKAYNLIKYDELVPNTTFIASVANNLSLSGNLSNPDNFPWWTTDSPNQYISSFTNENGSYLVNNIAYDASNFDGTQFSVTPYKENHNFFDPPGRTVYIRLDYNQHQNINFVDNSLFAVTGEIYYQGFSECTIDSAEVLIKYLGDTEFKSTEPPTYTTDGGKYRMDIEPEKTFVIKTNYKDHLFPTTYSFYNITSDKSIDFIDPTVTKSLHGSVFGGICEPIDLGPYHIQYTEKNDCIDKTIYFTGGTDFEITNLPPLEFDVTISMDNIEADLMEDILTANLDDYNQETALPGQADSMLVYQHYPPLRVDIGEIYHRVQDESSGDTSYELVDQQCNNDAYILEQGEDYSAYFQVKEAYSYIPDETNSYTGECLMESFKLNWVDNLTGYSNLDQNIISIVDSMGVMDSTGLVEYFFTARKPNIVGDLEGNYQDTYDFQQYLQLDGYDSNESIGRPVASSKLFAYVNGKLEDPDQINVNTTTSEIPFFVLRDPPGDASYSYLSEEQQVCQTMSINMADSDGNASSFSASTGADVQFEVGVSAFGAHFATTIDIDVTADFGYSTTATSSTVSTEEISTCFTVSNTYSTSDDENFIGADGDIFVGAGMSLTFSKAINQTTDYNDGNCLVEQAADYIYGLDGLANTYMHTQSFIENTMIPQLEAQALIDSNFQAQADSWRDLIALNEAAKADAVPASYDLLSGNPGGSTDGTLIDWSSGISFEFSKTNEVSYSSSFAFDYTVDTETAQDIGIEVNGLGFGMGFAQFSSSSDGYESSESQTNATTNGFVFADDDPGDHFLVEIKEDKLWGMPVYNLIGGQSECPWEIPTAKRYDPILQVAGVDGANGNEVVVNEVGEFDAAPLSFTVANNSQSGEAKTYMFRLVNESNPLGALVTYNGQPMTSPFQISVDAPVEDAGCFYAGTCADGDSNPCGECIDGYVSCLIDSYETGESCSLANTESDLAAGDTLHIWKNYYFPSTEMATVYVRKDDASDEFNYEGLMFEQYAGCEEGNPEQTDTARVNVNFERPCTAVTLSAHFFEGVDWTINENNINDTLKVHITNYDLIDPSDSNVENLDEIYIQYADTGTEDWISMEAAAFHPAFGTYGTPTVSIDVLDDYFEGAPAYYTFILDMSGFTEEIGGSGYKLRAVTYCSAFNKNYSNVLEGIIDTEPPLSFGQEPGDNILSGGDEISISFGEMLDCNNLCEVPQDMNDCIVAQNMTTNTEWSTPDPGLIATCIDNKVVLNIMGSVAAYTVENDDIKITATGFRDLLGNVNTEVYSWTFLYNQNPISWSEPIIKKDIYIGDDVAISTILQNVGGATSPFVFDDLLTIPDWLSIDPMEGWLNSQGQTDITLTLDPYMDIGSYYNTIYAENNDGFEPLTLDLNVLCRPPVWEHNYANYQYSMQIIAQLAVENSLSSDIYDRVVATIDGEVRGVGHIEKFYTDSTQTDSTYLTYLTIHGNTDDYDKVLEFRIWDNDNCRELWNVELDADATYLNNELIGNFGSPAILNAVDLSTAQHIDLHAGWSWASLNLNSDDMTVANALSYLDPASGDYIGSQSQYSQYSESLSSWEGDLDVLTNQSMYHINLAEQDELTFVGLEVNPDSVSIDYTEGWSWVGYTPQDVLEIDEGLINLSASQYDIIKSKYGFAEYVPGNGWMGTLSHMHPGEGYMLNAAASGSFTYPGTDRGDGLLARTNVESNEARQQTMNLYAAINLNPHEYEHSMSIISDMRASASFLSEHNLEDLSFIAYVDDNIRGISKLQTYVEIDKDLLFLSVYGNKPNEKVYIRIYDEVTEEEFLTSLEFGFDKNGIIGSVNSPATLSGIVPVIPEAYKLSQNYPNPFNPSTRIDFQTPEDGQVDISIYNIRGQEVITLKSEFMEAGYGSLTWNGTDHSGTMLPTGIYFVKMEAVNYHMTRKMMLLK